jgi:hypothetical protein
MLPLLLAAIVFLFLVVGSIAFLLCAAVPRLRQYALSVALWCAMWGPCFASLLLIAGLGLVAAAFMAKAGDMRSFQFSRLVPVFGWGYLTVGILVTLIVATTAAWMHQAIVKRFTFVLFRIYAATVCAGIGSVFGWSFGWWIMTTNLNGYVSFFLWIPSMLALVTAFGFGAYRGARGLRGKAPERFAFVTPAEYEGAEESDLPKTAISATTD